MNVNFTEEDLLFVKAEYERFLVDYDHDSFCLSCKSHCRLLIESHNDGAKYVALQAIDALRAASPLSMIRVGDGEGNVLGFFACGNDKELKWFNSIFYTQDAQTLSYDAAKSFSRELVEAFSNADIIGLRTFLPTSAGSYTRDISYINNIKETFEKGEIRGALGMLRAIQYGKSAVESFAIRNAVITSTWIYFGLLESLDLLLESAPRVIVITGRHELAGCFSDKLKSRLAAFLAIPVLPRDALPGRQFHFPTRFRETLEVLQTDLRGTLVLVGAGLFGKIYCATAKRNGGVALDLGSGFDILAGKLTRPVHLRHGLVDLDRISWIKAGEVRP